MLSIDEASARLTAALSPIRETESLALAGANRRVLVDDVYAPVSLPPFNSSAMDGYAVRTADVASAKTELKVVGTSFAGKPFDGAAAPGETVRIFTGAAVPAWADAIVIQEDVERSDERVIVSEAVQIGQNIRSVGHDICANDLLLPQGTKLGAFEVGWLAACGVATVNVVRPIQVALFSTGDELQDPGQPLQYGQIYDSNRATLVELLRSQAVTVIDLGRFPDDPASIETALTTNIGKVDLIVTSGGVSVGDSDFVRPVIEKLGELSFWNVALKPGKPIAFAKLNETWFLGLPGNPVSTVVCYLLFVKPALDALSGVPYAESLTLPATLTESVRHTVGRREYQRGLLYRGDDSMCVKPTGDQSSNRLASLAYANCLILVPEEQASIEAGRVVDVLPLPREADHFIRMSAT